MIYFAIFSEYFFKSSTMYCFLFIDLFLLLYISFYFWRLWLENKRIASPHPKISTPKCLEFVTILYNLTKGNLQM